jgi:hypothetical protein
VLSLGSQLTGAVAGHEDPLSWTEMLMLLLLMMMMLVV